MADADEVSSRAGEEVIFRSNVEQYHKERERIAQQGFETSHHCDQWTLTVAGAGLGLSFTFVKEIVPSAAPVVPWALASGWGCLVMAVACTLASLHFGVASFEAYDKDLCQTAQPANFGYDFWTKFKTAYDKRWWPTATTWTSRLGGTFTIAGLAMLLAFAFCNYGNEGTRNGKEPESPSTAPSSTAATPSPASTPSGAEGLEPQ